MFTASNAGAGSGSTSVAGLEPQPHAFLCSACPIQFKTPELRRVHMKEPWHVYNIKRRMASLPPISAYIFETQIESNQLDLAASGHLASDTSSAEESDTSSSDDSESSVDETPEAFPPTHCIFCQIESSKVEDNLSHMHAVHGLYIPDTTYLTDLETFIGYLGTVVSAFHECLYCGHVKKSAQGIRQHMLAKGHCMINLGPDSDLLEFWDYPEDAIRSVSNTSKQTAGKDSKKLTMQLPSGVVVTPNSKNNVTAGKTTARHRSFARRALVKSITEGKDEQQREVPTSERQRRGERRVVARGEMGMLGVTDHQRQALRATEKKLLRQEVVARARQRWGVEKVANRQKYFKPDVPGRLLG